MRGTLLYRRLIARAARRTAETCIRASCAPEWRLGWPPVLWAVRAAAEALVIKPWRTAGFGALLAAAQGQLAWLHLLLRGAACRLEREACCSFPRHAALAVNITRWHLARRARTVFLCALSSCRRESLGGCAADGGARAGGCQTPFPTDA